MSETKVKRGRGRPKGVKNKKREGAKKWGRPKGSKNKKKYCKVVLENGESCKHECIKSESYCLKHYEMFINQKLDYQKPICNKINIKQTNIKNDCIWTFICIFQFPI